MRNILGQESVMADAKKSESTYRSTGAVHDYAAIHKTVSEKGGGFFLPSVPQSVATATPISSACSRCKSVYESKLKKYVNECTNKCKIN